MQRKQHGQCSQTCNDSAITPSPDAYIGVFDSGVGGISVLREARALLPHERFIYLGDNANAPYGTKTESEIQSLAIAAAGQLMEWGLKALVVACNTATSAAIDVLRAKYKIPVIGMEPAIKPANAIRKNGAVLVLATPATLALKKFTALMSLYGDGVIPVACGGLMELVESGRPDSPETELYLTERLGAYENLPVDAIVLGCTHYLFVRPVIKRLFPGTPIIDGNAGTARQLCRKIAEKGLLRESGEGSATFLTTGDEAFFLPLMEKLSYFTDF